LNDRKALSIALRRMREAEGIKETERLVWDALRGVSNSSDDARASFLSEWVKGKQALAGTRSPKCGMTMAAEILAQIGILLNETEG
jgi:hypothetical protein